MHSNKNNNNKSRCALILSKNRLSRFLSLCKWMKWSNNNQWTGHVVMCIWYLFVFLFLIFWVLVCVVPLFSPYLNNVIIIMCGFALKRFMMMIYLTCHRGRKMFLNIKYVISFFLLKPSRVIWYIHIIFRACKDILISNMYVRSRNNQNLYVLVLCLITSRCFLI